MKIIATLTISIAILLIAIALYNISRQKLFIDNCSKEFRNTLKDAESIKQELENLMENSVELSRLIVDHIDGKIAHVDSIAVAREKEPVAILPDNSVIATIDETPSPAEVTGLKLKVFELAKELGMSSKTLISLLREMGYPVSHHMKLLDERVIQLVREEVLLRSFKTNGETGKSNNLSSPETQISKTGSALSAIPMMNSSERQRIEEHQHLALVRRGEGYVGTLNSEKKVLDFSVDDLKSAHPYLAVRSLYEKGLTIKEIAQLLDRGQGEVSLILNLARKKQACI